MDRQYFMVTNFRVGAAFAAVVVSVARDRRPKPPLTAPIFDGPAVRLHSYYYDATRFVATGVRRGYYSDNREDALIMWKEWDGESA